MQLYGGNRQKGFEIPFIKALAIKKGEDERPREEREDGKDTLLLAKKVILKTTFSKQSKPNELQENQAGIPRIAKPKGRHWGGGGRKEKSGEIVLQPWVQQQQGRFTKKTYGIFQKGVSETGS